MRVLIVHQEVSPGASLDEQDVLVQADYVASALHALGHQHARLPVTLDMALLRAQLIAARPDCVFNLVESLGGSDRLMALAPATMEALNIPFTGSPASALVRTNDKAFAKRQLRDAGLPTADWATGEEGTLEPPYIVKALSEHASLGIDDAAVVYEETRPVQEVIAERSGKLQCECFAEQYIGGREFNLSLLDSAAGPQLLPPSEIDFSAFAAGRPKIVGYAAKWHADSLDYVQTPQRFVNVAREARLCARLREIALACWRLFGLRGYARVDFRVDAAGEPWVLEVNCNSCLSPDAGFAGALAEARISWHAAVQRILDSAFVKR